MSGASLAPGVSRSTELRRSGAFTLIEYPAWTRSRDDLSGAIAQGAGMVVLVGGKGSGRTSLLATHRRRHGGAGPAARGPGSAGLHRPVSMIADDLDLAAIDRLAAAPPARGPQIVAITPELLAALVAAFPEARVVRMRPMASLDVRMMIDARLEQAGRAVEALSARAVLRLEELCGGNPRRLDQLLGRADLIAGAAGDEQVTAEHVDAAARRLPGGATGRSGPEASPRLGPSRRGTTPAGQRTRPDGRPARGMTPTEGPRRVMSGRLGPFVAAGLVGVAGVALVLAFADRPQRTEAPDDTTGRARVAAASSDPAAWDQTSEATRPGPAGSAADALADPVDPPAMQQTASQTPKPDLPPPELPAPDSPVPESLVPESLVPESPVPESPVPESPLPDSPAPERPTAVETAPALPATVFVRVPRPEVLPTASPSAPPGAVQDSEQTARLPDLPPTVFVRVPRRDLAIETLSPATDGSPATIQSADPAPGPAGAQADAEAAVTALPSPPVLAIEQPPAALADDPPPVPQPPTPERVDPPAVQEAAPAAAAATMPPARPAGPAEAARLLAMGKALTSIGELGDGRAMLAASAKMGNAEAAALLAASVSRHPALRARGDSPGRR